MPRRFNFTGRSKISQSDISIRLVRKESRLSFEADLRLKQYNLDSASRVFIEAYRGASTLWKRFDFGRVGLTRAESPCWLDEFGTEDGILFRVKITGQGGELGRLLAAADRIRPLGEDDKHAALPLISVEPADLGGDVWRIEFDCVDRPVLLVSTRFPDWKDVARSAAFRGFVCPAAMREILTRILLIDLAAGDDEDEADWKNQWIRFAESLTSECPGVLDRDGDPGVEVIITWIDEAVAAFCSNAALLDKLLSPREEVAV